MKKLLLVACLWAVVSAGWGKKPVVSHDMFVSPLGAIAVGPNGLPTNKAKIQPYCCPSDAIEISTSTVITENDFQWILIPLQVHKSEIKGVSVCYSVSSKTTGATYISQTRLTQMTTPDKALVVLDDPTNRTAMGPACYTVPASVSVEGTITLELKVVFGSANDKIRIGGITIATK